MSHNLFNKEDVHTAILVEQMRFNKILAVGTMILAFVAAIKLLEPMIEIMLSGNTTIPNLVRIVIYLLALNGIMVILVDFKFKKFKKRRSLFS